MVRDETVRQPDLLAATVAIQVVHATPGQCWRVHLQLPLGSTVGDAIEASGLRERLPEAIGPAGVGVHSRPCSQEQVLRDGDRVELYRPLLVDPKERRRRRARQR